MRLRTAIFIVLATTAVASLGSAASASNPTELCNPNGRAICITTSDIDGVSHSTTSFARHTVYTVSIRNGSGSTLTNVRATLELVDVVAGVDEPSGGAFVGATLPTVCTLDTPTHATCELSNLAGGAGASLGSFGARTSTNLAAGTMRLDVTVQANERANDRGDPVDPNVDTFTKGEPTSLEQISDLSASIAFSGGSTVLDTSPDDEQFSQFFVRVPAAFTGFQLTTLEEFDAGAAGYFCPAGVTCFGQSVKTSAPGIFSSGNPAELKSTVLLSSVGKGVTPKSLVVHHDPDVGPTIEITAACSGAIGAQPPVAELPCRRVVFDRKAGVAIIDAWDHDQGDWGFS
jgi:hypothetical protein